MTEASRSQPTFGKELYYMDISKHTLNRQGKQIKFLEIIIQKRDWQTITHHLFLSSLTGDFSDGPVVKNLPANAGDAVRSLLWEDSICHRKMRPKSHNYWRPCTLEPMLRNKRARTLQQRPKHSQKYINQ